MSQRRRFVLKGLTCLVFVPTLVAFAGAANPRLQLKDRVDRQVEPYLTNDVVLGLTIGVVQDQQSHVFGYGKRSQADSRPPDGDTIYEIGSVTKVFTGLLLADAVVRRRLRLDQPLQELLPAEVAVSPNGDVPIQLIHLATHTSGLPRLPANMAPADATNPYADYTAEALYAFVDDLPVQRPAGTSIEYSNLAFGLLGNLLAREAETTYEQLLRERILEPLKMGDTAIRLTPAARQRLAPPHWGDGSSSANWDFDALAGAGAIRSTATDMLAYVRANLDPPQDELGQAIELAWKVHQQGIADANFAMGLGWHLARDGQTRWHNGQTGGYHAMVLINRTEKIGVVALTNTANGEIDRLAEDLMQMLAGATVTPRTFENRKTVRVDPEVLQRYAGKFQLAPGVVFTVSADNDKLMVGLTGQPTFQVFPRSETEWFYKVVEATLTFKVGDDGPCRELVLFQNGVRQTATRVQ